MHVNGRYSCDLYKFLRKNSELDSTQIGLNFGKFLVNREGKVIRYYGPLSSPVDFIDEIESLLV